tara:strand:+ start:181 stop:618 length:438 start_codon:yes stop_codon:yes gene_type:complete
MEKKEQGKPQNVKNQSLENKNLRISPNSKIKNNKSLPWWVELLFVQIGLPDKFLIKILKTNKKFRDLLKSEKKLFITSLFVLAGITYFYPVVKYSANKLECEDIAKKYIIENKNLINLNKKKLRMLSTNFCNGGEEVYEIENSKK